MQKIENSSSRVKSIAFVDYKPAEIKINKDWMIVYYAKNPVTNLLERQRLRVPMMENKTERLRHAKKITLEINNKLIAGWSPYLEESGKNYKSFKAAVADYLKHINKQLKDDVLRPDTIRTYNSNLNLLEEFIQKKHIKITFALQINKSFCVQYLDWVYMDRNSSPRTYNNHLSFLTRFCKFLLSRGILNENPAAGILPMKLLSKERAILPEEIKLRINKELSTYNNAFQVVCMATYYCFIRNTELGKLLVNMVNLDENYIFLSKNISKNKKDEFVTIPEKYKEILTKHIGNAPGNYFLFSKNDFMPGPEKMPIRKIDNHWDKIRLDLKLPSKYKFYSYKDTGITDLLNSGVAAIKVRDQARHYDIKITEIYTPRSKGCDETIKNANVKF